MNTGESVAPVDNAASSDMGTGIDRDKDSMDRDKDIRMAPVGSVVVTAVAPWDPGVRVRQKMGRRRGLRAHVVLACRPIVQWRPARERNRDAGLVERRRTG